MKDEEMRMFDYCERMDASFFAEPVNAFTNVFFILAAYLSYTYLQKSSSKVHTQNSIYILSTVLVCIGIGSFLWHTFATPWAELADVIPITVFIYVYLFAFVRLVLEQKIVTAVSALMIFTVVNYGMTRYADATFLNGSIAYAPALLSLLVLAVLARQKRRVSFLLQAIFVFILSLLFRSIDFMMCEAFSFGTHFLWHICNSIMLYMLMVFLMDTERVTEVRRHND
jgi:hypothetical protein